jgi:hypothetical protein
VPSSSNLCCDHANLIEENSRFKAKLAKGLITCIQWEKNLNDLLSNQSENVGNEGLRFAPQSKQNNNERKA